MVEMPNTWVDAEEALQHKGVSIYYTYKDDDLDQGQRTYWFVTEPYLGEDHAFDVRDLPTWKAPKQPPFLMGKDNTLENQEAWKKYWASKAEENAVLRALREAIEQGLIPRSEEQVP